MVQFYVGMGTEKDREIKTGKKNWIDLFGHGVVTVPSTGEILRTHTHTHTARSVSASALENMTGL